MGERRTCDIRAVSEADRLQTRFRRFTLLPLRLIKLSLFEKTGMMLKVCCAIQKKSTHLDLVLKRERLMSDMDWVRN